MTAVGRVYREIVQHSVTAGPRANLSRVVADLGATLLELVHGDPDRPGEISAVVFHDPLDQPVLPSHALVLGVGVEAPGRVAALLRTLGRQNAAALVLREPVPLTDAVRAAADEASVAVLGLRRGAPWGHLSEMLRSLLSQGAAAGPAEEESLGGLPAGDLFAVANAIAALLDAPVTIEDRNSRVLAFSGRQDEADPSRVETILGRQVPERYARVLHERGIFRDLLRSDQTVFIEPIADGAGGYTLPRVAISVRAGDEVLGSVWAAIPEPLSDERDEALRESAKLVALHMLRVRAGADVQRRMRADLLSTALEGGVGAGEALERLGLSGQPLLVLGVTLDERGLHSTDSATVVHDRQSLNDAFALHLSAIHPRSTAAAIGAVTYGLVPLTGAPDKAETGAVRILQDFLDRVGDRLPPISAVGPMALDLSGVAHSRSCVDRVLRVLREGRLHRRIGRFDELQGEALISELRDLTQAWGEKPAGALARLIDYDRRHRGNLVQTLRAWLHAFGDVAAAAESVAVHQNTFRYRLRRIAEVGQCDLGNPDQRFAMMVQLQVLRINEPPHA
ncbi:helix-turn-helix domain-containing protein [Actinomadura madurae]|uniref:helix-turn-helix domain-containing protein n=1 Tax=Actinomadura madurae TaxID=1993 RepID=UPI0020269134|nr:helix-turn-helix domain-containing protein [Actinomadura madurae]URN05042.1 helix-turn-helix domain-containing protein [Actinomadura madurae]